MHLSAEAPKGAREHPLGPCWQCRRVRARAGERRNAGAGDCQLDGRRVAS